MVVAANISDSLNYIVDTLVPSVMSTSFGSCESSLGSGNNQFLANLWQQAATSGITSMVSSGDSGAAGCDAASSAVATQGLAVNGFCTPPAAICVGGTEFFYDYSTNASQYWSASGAFRWDTSRRRPGMRAASADNRAPASCGRRAEAIASYIRNPRLPGRPAIRAERAVFPTWR